LCKILAEPLLGPLKVLHKSLACAKVQSFILKLRTNIKINTRQFLTIRRYLHKLAILATAEGIELSSLNGRVRNIILGFE